MDADPVEAVIEALRAAGAAGTVRRLAEPVSTAAAAAAVLGCPTGAIANSLVFLADGEPLLVLASGGHRVDTAHLATQVGAARIRSAGPAAVFAATGQHAGGVAPVGHRQPLPTVVDTELAEFSEVWAGAGDDYAMFPTTFTELLRITRGRAVTVR